MYHDNIQEYVSQAAAANFNQANSGYRPPMVSNQIRPPGFPPVQNPHANNQNNFNRGNNFNQNRGNNFNQGQIYRPPVPSTSRLINHTIKDCFRQTHRKLSSCTYSVWKSLSLPELTPTCMTLELADRSITEPIGIAEDVFVNENDQRSSEVDPTYQDRGGHLILEAIYDRTTTTPPKS
ncbi:hypothetical protein Tco_0908882 [Tanacetum coccineum]|uniref:Uncharacterized protein n=1 Tax=Tanacetum coccineum TaxID=301880 RepID=A0ABQ5CR64_9ASTR